MGVLVMGNFTLFVWNGFPLGRWKLPSHDTRFFLTVLRLDWYFVGFVQLDDSLFVEIEIGQLMVVDDPDGPFTVKAFDANHSPGNLFFIFYSFWLTLYCILLFNWSAYVGFVEIVKFCSYCWIFHIKCIWVWFYFGFELLSGFFWIGFDFILLFNNHLWLLDYVPISLILNLTNFILIF